MCTDCKNLLQRCGSATAHCIGGLTNTFVQIVFWNFHLVFLSESGRVTPGNRRACRLPATHSATRYNLDASRYPTCYSTWIARLAYLELVNGKWSTCTRWFPAQHRRVCMLFYVFYPQKFGYSVVKRLDPGLIKAWHTTDFRKSD